MKIISIDPGFDRFGWAILKKDPKEQKAENIKSGCFTTNKKESFENRLYSVGCFLNQIIKQEDPKEIAIETLFFSTNKKTALQIAEIRGMVIFISKNLNLDIFEYHPNTIKLSITGSGQANKEQIKKMISFWIKNINTSEKIDDEIDALAIGVTHLNQKNIHNVFK